MLPVLRTDRPLIYWHFKTLLLLAAGGDANAFRELAEHMAEILEENASSCLRRGEVGRARELEGTRARILEGIQ